MIDDWQGSLDKARALLSVYEEENSPPDVIGGHHNDGCDSFTLTTTKTPPSNVLLEEGDFAKGHWSDATVVYAASAYFDDALMLDIAKRCRELGEGARVVTLNKPLPKVVELADDGDGGGGRGVFRVMWQCQMKGSWGGSAIAFVHHQAPPVAPVG